MNVDLVIRNAVIVSPTGQTNGDLLISAGKVAGIVFLILEMVTKKGSHKMI